MESKYPNWPNRIGRTDGRAFTLPSRQPNDLTCHCRIFGISVHAFTIIHVIISLVAIASGLYVVLSGLIRHSWSNGLTTFFLATTIATSLTGFCFPAKGLDPPKIVGLISLLLLAVALWARYQKPPSTRRGIFLTTSIAALYLNVFVGLVQLFQKVPILAEGQRVNQLPFITTQLLALVIFVILCVTSVKRLQIATNA
jgi:hypothetical protein